MTHSNIHMWYWRDYRYNKMPINSLLYYHKFVIFTKKVVNHNWILNYHLDLEHMYNRTQNHYNRFQVNIFLHRTRFRLKKQKKWSEFPCIPRKMKSCKCGGVFWWHSTSQHSIYVAPIYTYCRNLLSSWFIICCCWIYEAVYPNQLWCAYGNWKMNVFIHFAIWKLWWQGRNQIVW